MDLVTSELGLFFWIFFIVFVIVFPLFALISVLSNRFPNNEKLIWVLVILFAPLFGAIAYFIIGKSRRITK
ncbi:PLD nuclease N-terminal domain-containing protein [Subsaxibacter sp. CAU 1640]|uniref:PLD nuclease N-terminal domain-containing protein n=1 Tax=Subsaxibacter sp. CAU 1640 TaxID=2933271 RepID=UPI002006B296|nr:PLD nuclease N-terminal domain-containing protein [Subsaxibacter sp. CAU 1640]MCK7591900.1 PLD nuclease N-terminal domain-containing protein [Subsaxibacter sp. CAU 1640]